MWLNNNVWYTALVMMNMIRGDPSSLPLCNRYVMAIYVTMYINTVSYMCVADYQ